MATSTSTLLEVVNRVLLRIGERQVAAFNTYPAQKAKLFVLDAFNNLVEAYDWSYLRSKNQASSWSDEVATVPAFRRIFGVSVRLSSGFRRNLKELTWDDYTVKTPTEGIPLFFWVENETTVHVIPYPATAEEDNVYFDCMVIPTEPDATTDTFPVPERYIRYIEQYAVAKMISEHLDDVNSSIARMREADQILVNFIRMEGSGRATGQVNMWRGNRPY